MRPRGSFVLKRCLRCSYTDSRSSCRLGVGANLVFALRDGAITRIAPTELRRYERKLVLSPRSREVEVV
jgi:hypothetical protein